MATLKTQAVSEAETSAGYKVVQRFFDRTRPQLQAKASLGRPVRVSEDVALQHFFAFGSGATLKPPAFGPADAALARRRIYGLIAAQAFAIRSQPGAASRRLSGGADSRAQRPVMAQRILPRAAA